MCVFLDRRPPYHKVTPRVISGGTAPQAVSKHGVVIRCYTPPGKSHQGMFALDTAVKVCSVRSLVYTGIVHTDCVASLLRHAHSHT